MINVTTKYYSGFNILMAFYMYNLQTENHNILYEHYKLNFLEGIKSFSFIKTNKYLANLNVCKWFCQRKLYAMQT